MTSDSQVATHKRKCSEANLEAEDITLGNPVYASAEKGTIGQHLHTSKTPLRLVQGHDGALSKDMARIHLTVESLRGAIRAFEHKKTHQKGYLKEDHKKELMNLRTRLVRAVRRERQQKYEEGKPLEQTSEGLQTSSEPEAKRRKSSEPDNIASKARETAVAGYTSNHVCKDDVEMIAEMTEVQEDQTQAYEVSKASQQQSMSAVRISKSIVTPTEDGSESQPSSGVPDCQDEKTSRPLKSKVPKRPWLSLAGLKENTEAEEEDWLQKYKEKPANMSLSVWCDLNGLPKQRPAGKGPFPIESKNSKRSFEAAGLGTSNLQMTMEPKHKKQKQETKTEEQPIQSMIVKLKVPCQSEVLQTELVGNVVPKHPPADFSHSGIMFSELSQSRQETMEVEAAIKASLDEQASRNTYDDNESAVGGEQPNFSGSMSSIMKEYRFGSSTTEPITTNQQEAFDNHVPPGSNIQTGSATNAIEPKSDPCQPPTSPPGQSPPIADKSSYNLAWNFDEDTLCEEEDGIPPLGSTGYKAYVDWKLSEYCADKEAEANVNPHAEKTPSEEPKRIRCSKAFMHYAASFRAAGMGHGRTLELHKKNFGDLTEEERALVLSPPPRKPALPPIIGHEIAAKVHLEGTLTESKHRLDMKAKRRGKIEPVCKPPLSRSNVPKAKDRLLKVLIKLSNVKKSPLGPRKAKTKFVAPRKFPQIVGVMSAGAVYQNADGSWRCNSI